MNQEAMEAFAWAKQQKYTSVAAQYARLLADEIEKMQVCMDMKDKTIERLIAERDTAINKAKDANERKRGTMRKLGLYECLMKRIETDGFLRKELCNVDDDDCPSYCAQGYREAEYCEECKKFRHDFQANTEAPEDAEEGVE